MKKCSKCGEIKNETEFFVKDSKKNRLHAQCKGCYKEHRRNYYSEHYYKNHEAYLLRARERRVRIRNDIHKRMMDYLEGKSCVGCGEDDAVVLEFDHITPDTKEFSIARAISDGKKWEEILVEMNKCQILCSNCHKKKTAKEAGWYRRLD